MNREEFFKAMENPEETFKVLPEDNPSETNRKEVKQRWFSKSRFMHDQAFMTRDPDTILNLDRLERFIQRSMDGVEKPYFPSVDLPGPPDLVPSLVGKDIGV